jgi:DNA ligase (NAD+)
MSIDELVELINYHNHKYWVENNPEISDIEFDELIKQLKEKDSTNSALDYIGYITLNRPKITHNPPMLSLDKVYSPNDLIKWAEKIARSNNEIFKLEPKFDGIASKIQDGILSTSGDTGYEGENITDKWPLVKTLLDDNSKNQEFILGEIVFNKTEFEEKKDSIIRKNGKPYKIPRSAVVGLLSLDTVNKSIGNVLTFVDYNVYSTECTIQDLKDLDWDEYISAMKNWEFPLDGLVLKLKDKEYFNSLGNTTHHYKGQMALKFGNPTGITKLIDIELYSGKQSITPVGIVESVVIDGIENSRASLHNYKYIVDNDICIGDIIEIERCGEIIPQFKRIVEPAENRSVINNLYCPDCNMKLKYKEPILYCPNINCKGRLLRTLTDSVIRLGIEYLGPGTIKKLINEKNITTLQEILNLEYDDIINLSGFGEKSTDNLLNEINKIKTQPIDDYKLLASFNIPGIGITLSKKILANYTLDDLRLFSINDFEKLDSFGPERAKLLYHAFIEHGAALDQISAEIEIKNSINNQNNQKYKVCFTGKSDHPRNYWIDLAESTDKFEFIKSVTRELDLLVTNDLNSSSNKIKNATKYGIRMITYDTFIKLVNKINNQ